MINKGDTLQLILNYQLNGSDLEQDYFDDIELQLNSQSGRNSVKLLYSLGEIVWDSEKNKYVVYLSQEQTFKLKQNQLNEDSDVEYQLRVLLNSAVVSSDVGTFTIGPVLSKKVLEVES